MHLGLIAGMIGGLIGILGGLVGTYYGIKDTHGPKEKAFAIKYSIVCWITVIVFIALVLYLPKPYNFLLYIPYAIALPISIRYVNKKSQQIREGEKHKQVE